MEHNQGCSPFYFSCQLSALRSPLSVVGFFTSPFLLSFFPNDFRRRVKFFFPNRLPRDLLRRMSLFQQFCGKGRDKCVQLRE